jgi:hypothetical protein
MAGAAVPLLMTAGKGVGGAAAGGGIFATLSSVFSFGSAALSVFGGVQGMRASNAEAAQINQQRQFEALRAKQEEANRQAKLSEILSTQMAQTAGRGIQLGSGSDIAIADFSIEEARRESDIASMDSQFRQNQLQFTASQARRAGRASLISGLSSAASTTVGQLNREYERSRTS